MGGNVVVSFLLLDTHAWIWLALAEPKFKEDALSQIRRNSSEGSLFLSPISMWEVALKASRGKLALDLPIREWILRASRLPGLNMVTITPEIAAQCAELPPEFHGDPADRILAATARAEGLTLVTHDKALLQLARRGYFNALAT